MGNGGRQLGCVRPAPRFNPACSELNEPSKSQVLASNRVTPPSDAGPPTDSKIVWRANRCSPAVRSRTTCGDGKAPETLTCRMEAPLMKRALFRAVAGAGAVGLLWACTDNQSTAPT